VCDKNAQNLAHPNVAKIDASLFSGEKNGPKLGPRQYFGATNSRRPVNLLTQIFADLLTEPAGYWQQVDK
jgi:hypothetical protein